MLFIGKDPLFIDVVNRLSETSGISIRAIVTLPSFRSRLRSPDIEILDVDRFMLPEHIYRLNEDSDAMLVPAVLQQFVRCERDYLSISDRWGLGLSVAVRRRIYHELLRFWISFLQNEEITTVVFDRIPHSGWNNVIEHVAREFGMDTLFPVLTSINDRVLIKRDYHAYENVPQDWLADHSTAELLELMEPEMRADFETDNVGLEVSKDMIRNALSRRGKVRKSIANVRAGIQRIGNAIRKGRFLKTRFLPYNDPVNVVSGNWNRYRLRRRLRSLHGVYHRLALRDVDIERPYVLYTLHYEPEMTTFPMGGLLQDQFLVISILSKCLPEDWVLYVKEHPFQFFGADTCSAFRDRFYYERIAELPNVELVPIRTDTETLIQNARFTATLTGDPGWESLMMGKPCMVFGSPWYRPCNSAFHVTDGSSCADAINRIQHLTWDDVTRDVIRFLLLMQDRFTVTSISHRYASQSNRSYDELVDNYVQDLDRLIRAAPSKQPSVANRT